MDNHKEIIQKLAEGIDPITGETLNVNHICLNNKVVEALNYAVDTLEQEEKRLERKKKLPKNAGKAWNDELDKELISKFDEGISIEELVIIFERTKGSIKTKLEKLGKI